MIYFTLQGIKRMTVGERRLEHRPGTFLLASIDVPVVCAVSDCSQDRPYLGLAFTLDQAAMIGMPAALAVYANQLHQSAKAHKAAIDAAVSMIPASGLAKDALTTAAALVKSRI